MDGSLVQERGCQTHALVNQDDVSESDLERIISFQRLAARVALGIPYLGNHSCLCVNEKDVQNLLQPLNTSIPELGQVGGAKGKVVDRDSSSFQLLLSPRLIAVCPIVSNWLVPFIGIFYRGSAFRPASPISRVLPPKSKV